MARSDLEILAEIKLSNRREFDKQLRGIEKRKVLIDTKRSEQALGRITGKANEFTKSLEASNARVIAFGASVAVIEGVRRAFVELATTVVKVESSLTAINSIFGRSSETIGKFGDELFRIAKNTGQSFDDVAKAAQEFARQGLDVEQTLKRTNDALILTRLTTLNTEKAIGGLTAVVNGFAASALTTTDVINKLRSVETQFAVSSTDLIDAVSRSASVAQDAGISFDQLLGFITAIKQKTGLGGATIGQGLKTGLTRLNLPTRIQQLKDLGVAVDESASTFDNLVTASKAIAQAQKDGESSLATQIGTVVAGQFQISKLSALFRDLASSESISAGATTASTKAVNEAILANETYNKTIASISNEISQNIGQIFSGIGEAGLQDFFRDILKDVNVLLEAFQGKDIGGGGFLANIAKDIILTANELKLLAPLAEGFVKVLTGPAFITGLAIIANTLKNVFTQGGASLLQLSGINKTSEKRIANQRVIQSLLTQATASELKQLELASSQAQKETIILGILSKQLAIQKALESSSIRTAQSLSRQGIVLGGSVAGGNLSKKGGKNSFAGGTLGGAIQSEQRAINNGVGGASSNAQVRVVNAFNYGKGKVGPAVLNSDEILIPNKNGDVVLNRDMAGSSAISSMGGNFARGKIPMNKGRTYRASQDGFMKLLMGNTKFQSVKYYSSNSESIRKLTGVQHSSMVAQASKSGKPPPDGYSSWREYQRQNRMVTLRGMQGSEMVTKNIKLSNIRGVKAGGANYIPNFAEGFDINNPFPRGQSSGNVNISDAEIRRMEARIAKGQQLTPRQVSRVESAMKSGQSFKIPPILRQSVAEQSSFAAQQAARGSGRATPQTPPSGASQSTKVFPSRKPSVRDSQGRFRSGGNPLSNPGPNGFSGDLRNSSFSFTGQTDLGGKKRFAPEVAGPPAIIQPSLAQSLLIDAPTNFGDDLKNNRFDEFKRKFNDGQIPAGRGGDAKAFEEFKKRLRFEAVEAELKAESNRRGKNLTFEELNKRPEGRQLAQNIKKRGLTNYRQIEAGTRAAIQQNLLTDAQTQLQKSGKGIGGFDFGLDKKADRILQSPTGRRLSPEQRATFKESVSARKMQRGQRIQGAGFGLAFAGSMAAPLIGQGVESATGSKKAGGIASGIIGGASTGASLGAFTGNPAGMAIGAGIGALLGGITAAMADAEEGGGKYAKILDQQKEFFAQNINAMQSFISTQGKLTSALESGKIKGSQVANLFEDLQQSFNSLQSNMDISPELRGKFMRATGAEKPAVLDEIQRRGAKTTRLAQTQAAFESMSEKASDRKATIERKVAPIQGGGFGGYGSYGPTMITTNQKELDLSKFTEDEVSAVVGGLLAEVDLDKVDFSKLEKDGDTFSNLIAIGIPEKVAESINLQLDDNSTMKNLIDRELGNNNIGKKLQEQIINATLSKLDFSLKSKKINTTRIQENLFEAQGNIATGQRFSRRASEDMTNNRGLGNMNFLETQGVDMTKNKQQFRKDRIKQDFDRGVEDNQLAIAPALKKIFNEDIFANLTKTQKGRVAPELEKSGTDGVTFKMLSELKGVVTDADTKNELTKLEIQLANNQDTLINNTNALIRSEITTNRQIENQRVFEAALNDLSAGLGKTLPELFGTTKAKTSVTEGIRVQMREDFLKTDNDKLPGIGRNMNREVLQNTESPEAQALDAAAQTVKEQLQLLTRSIAEGGSLTQNESDVARAAIDREFSRTGGVSFSQEERSDVSGRALQALNASAEAGVDLSENVPATDAFKEGLDKTVIGLSQFSTILESILTRVDLPEAPPLPNVQGTASESIANQLGGELQDGKVAQNQAQQMLDVQKQLSMDFKNNAVTISGFTDRIAEVAAVMAKGIEVNNKLNAKLTLDLPQGSVKRLDNIESTVQAVEDTLRQFILDNLSS